MALGAITNLPIDNQHNPGARAINPGDQLMSVTTVVGDSSYPTGGTPLTPQQLGLNGVNFAIVSVTGSAANNAVAEASYNVATGKLQMWSGTTLAETANATNVSGITVQIVAFGY